MGNRTSDREGNRRNGQACLLDAFWFTDNTQIGACVSYDVEGVCRRDSRCEVYRLKSGEGNGQFQPECMKKYREPGDIHDCSAIGVIGVCDMDLGCRVYRETAEQSGHAGAADSI